MRWTKPRPGEYRTKSCFLIFPKCIDGVCRWMEAAVFQEKLFCSGGETYWEGVKWLDREAYAKSSS